ncbi:MAG: glycosyltransferase family 4 protein [Solirubrobacteraceae bacterium]
MRIVMVSDFYPPFLGGVEVLVSSLSRELVRRGHTVFVATLAAPGLPMAEDDAGVQVRRIATTTQRADRLFASSERPWAPPVPDPEAVVALRRVLGQARPDVVHGHDWLARSYLPLKRRGGPPFVMSLHYFTLSCPKKSLMRKGAPCAGPGLAKCLACAGDHYGRAKGTAVVLGQRAFARAEAALTDLFLPVSAATAAGNGLPAARLPYEIVPNLVPAAADPAPHAQLLDRLPIEPFLLFVGDVRRDKGADVLIDAYARLSRPPPLVLIGEVWPDAPRTLPPGATLLGAWPNAAVREAMRRSLALVAPSIWPEPFGIVVAEALTAGRPVVASAIGGIPEIVRDGRDGLLVTPANAGALAAALERIAGDASLRERLAAGAAERARQYAPEAVTHRFEEAYARVLRGRPATTAVRT